MLKLTQNQKEAILKATRDRDYCILAHKNTLNSLCNKKLASFSNGFGHKFGRIIELNDNGKNLRRKLIIDILPKSTEINVDDIDFYEHDNSDLNKRTRNRLNQIKELGLTEVGIAQFGVPQVLSGLYIEMIWNYKEFDWLEYIRFIEETIDKYILKTL